MGQELISLKTKRDTYSRIKVVKRSTVSLCQQVSFWRW